MDQPAEPHRSPRAVDLVGEVMADRKDWPPYALVCELVTKAKAVHLGEVKLRVPNGETDEVVSYVDRMQTRRDRYRLKQRGILVGELKPSTSSAARWTPTSRRRPRTGKRWHDRHERSGSLQGGGATAQGAAAR
jgi:hypothetical protein